MAPARGGKGKKSKKQGGNKIAAIWTKFLNMSTMDRIMTATGVAVLILAIVTGSVYASARMVDHQVSEFVSVGSQLDGIQMIGEQGMLAVADAKQVDVNGKSCTAFPCQVAAKQLTDDIEARMVVNGKYGPVYTYTVKDYLNYLLEHDYPQQAKELAGTLLVYGGKAQLYFGYRTDALAGTAEPNSTANWGSYQFESSGTQTDDYYGSSLLLEPVIQIRHYFMVPDGAEFTFTFAWNAGEPETELQPVDTNTRFDGKKVYYVVTPAIAFRRADAMPVVAMRQNGADLCILRYGVFSYGDMVRALAAVDESQLPLLNLLRALDDLTTAAQRYSVAG